MTPVAGTFEKVHILLVDRGAEPYGISATTHLRDDLWMDSLDMAEFVRTVEEAFAIEITDADLETINTVGDLVAHIDRVRP